MTLPSHFPRVPRVKVYVFMCLSFNLARFHINSTFDSPAVHYIGKLFEKPPVRLLGVSSGWQVGENVTRQMGMTKNWLDSIDINYRENGWETFCTIIYQSSALYLCFKELTPIPSLVDFWKMLSCEFLWLRRSSLRGFGCRGRRASVSWSSERLHVSWATHEHILVHSKAVYHSSMMKHRKAMKP